MNEEHLRLLQAAVGIQVDTPSVPPESDVDVEVDLANLQTDEIEKLLAQLQGVDAGQTAQQQQHQPPPPPELRDEPRPPTHQDAPKPEVLNEAVLAAELEKTIEELSQVTTRAATAPSAAAYTGPHPLPPGGYQPIGHQTAIPQPLPPHVPGPVHPQGQPVQLFNGQRPPFQQPQQPQPQQQQIHQHPPHPQHPSHQVPQRALPQHPQQPNQQLNYARPTVPRRQPNTSQHGGATDELDDPSKAAERERIREENRERKKRWREVNQDRNKDNDLRCRVTKRAAKLYGSMNSEEKQKWIIEEFNRRKNKREQKEKARSEGPHFNGGTGVFLAAGHDFLHQLLPSIYSSNEAAATDDVVRMLVNIRTSKEMLEQLTRFLVSYPRIVEHLLNRVSDASKREQLRQYIASQTANRQKNQQQSNSPAPPPSTPTGSTNTGPNSGLDGTGNLPEGFDAILADIQKQLPVALAGLEQPTQTANTQQPAQTPLHHSFDDLPDLTDEDDVDVDALLAALQAADNGNDMQQSSGESVNGSDSHSRQQSLEIDNNMFSQSDISLANVGELSSEELENLIRQSGIDLDSLDVDLALQTLQQGDEQFEKEFGVPAQPPNSPVGPSPVQELRTPLETLNTESLSAAPNTSAITTASQTAPTVTQTPAPVDSQAVTTHQGATVSPTPSVNPVPTASQTQESGNQNSRESKTAEPDAMDIDSEGIDLSALEGLGDLDSMDPEQIDALLNELRGAGESVDTTPQPSTHQTSPQPTAPSATPVTTPPVTSGTTTTAPVTAVASPAQPVATAPIPSHIPTAHPTHASRTGVPAHSTPLTQPQVTSAPPRPPTGSQPAGIRPSPPAYGKQDQDTSGQYTPETIAAILRCLLEGLPQMPQPPPFRGVKRPPPVPYMPPGQKRPRGPSPNMPGPSPVNQLHGILQTSMDANGRPHGPTPLMPPAYSARYGNTEALNKKLMALKPPPYKPAPKPDKPPVITPPLGVAPPKKKEDEKRIKAMGFPPLMAGLKRPTS